MAGRTPAGRLAPARESMARGLNLPVARQEASMSRQDPELERWIDSIAEQECDSEEDVAMGLCYAIQEQVEFPLDGRVLGEPVQVLRVEESNGLDVLAVCERNGKRYRVRLQDVELVKGSTGGRWIEAYRQLLGRDGSPQTGLVRQDAVAAGIVAQGLWAATRKPAAVLTMVNDRYDQHHSRLSPLEDRVQQPPEVGEVLNEQVIDPVLRDNRLGDGGSANDFAMQAVREQRRPDDTNTPCDIA
jgi:hypothetical protein